MRLRTELSVSTDTRLPVLNPGALGLSRPVSAAPAGLLCPKLTALHLTGTLRRLDLDRARELLLG